MFLLIASRAVERRIRICVHDGWVFSKKSKFSEYTGIPFFTKVYVFPNEWFSINVIDVLRFNTRFFFLNIWTKCQNYSIIYSCWINNFSPLSNMRVLRKTYFRLFSHSRCIEILVCEWNQEQINLVCYIEIQNNFVLKLSNFLMLRKWTQIQIYSNITMLMALNCQPNLKLS